MINLNICARKLISTLPTMLIKPWSKQDIYSTNHQLFIPTERFPFSVAHFITMCFSNLGLNSPWASASFLLLSLCDGITEGEFCQRWIPSALLGYVASVHLAVQRTEEKGGRTERRGWLRANEREKPRTLIAPNAALNTVETSSILCFPFPILLCCLTKPLLTLH